MLRRLALFINYSEFSINLLVVIVPEFREGLIKDEDNYWQFTTIQLHDLLIGLFVDTWGCLVIIIKEFSDLCSQFLIDLIV